MAPRVNMRRGLELLLPGSLPYVKVRKNGSSPKSTWGSPENALPLNLIIGTSLALEGVEEDRNAAFTTSSLLWQAVTFQRHLLYRPRLRCRGCPSGNLSGLSVNFYGLAT